MLLSEILSASPEKLVEVFYSLCPLEMLFGLLQHEELETRTTVLKIVDLYIKNPTIAMAFAKLKGFALTGQILKAYPVPESLLGVLFCMLLGKPTHLPDPTTAGNSEKPHGEISSFLKSNKNASTEVPEESGAERKVGGGKTTTRSQHFSVSANILGQLTEEIVLQHPEVMATILIALENPSISEYLRHSAIKTLHDIFLQNDEVKDLFIGNALIKLLCDLFVTGYQCKTFALWMPVEVSPQQRMIQSAGNIQLTRRKRIASRSKLAQSVSEEGVRYRDALLPMRTEFGLKSEEKESTQPLHSPSFKEEKAEELKEEEDEDEDEAVEDEDSEKFDWSFEEDLLCFLKAIALYGCTVSSNFKSGVVLVHDVLLVSPPSLLSSFILTPPLLLSPSLPLLLMCVPP